MYCYIDRVPFSRMDYSGKLSVSGVVDAMQDCCMFHSEEVGHSSQELLKKNRAWLVSSWHIVFDSRPKMGQKFRVKTWPYKFQGVIGSRNFVMETMDGEVLCYADSHWFYADVSTGKPVRIEKEELDAYPVEPRYEMEKVSRKVKCPDELKRIQTVEVCQNYLDTNGHMNNGQYIRLAVNVLPPDYAVRELCAEYRLAAHMGDTLYLKTAQQDGYFYVVITDKEGIPYFLSKFKSYSEGREVRA